MTSQAGLKTQLIEQRHGPVQDFRDAAAGGVELM